MKHFVQIIIAVLFSSILVSCKKDYPTKTLLEENQRAQEEQEPLLPNEMLETEGLRLSIDYPPGTAKMAFRLFKASPNRSEVKIGIVEESRDYFIISKLLDNNTDFILTVEYQSVSSDGAFQLAINGILSLKGPAGLNLPSFPYTTANAGVRREVLKIRKGSLKFAFFPL
jgi:hypothetical protein